MVTYAMYQAKLEECYSLALPKQLRDAVQRTAILLSEGKSVTISATEQETHDGTSRAHWEYRDRR